MKHRQLVVRGYDVILPTFHQFTDLSGTTWNFHELPIFEAQKTMVFCMCFPYFFEDMKWVIARSLLESLHWHSTILAVIIGAAPGDVAALTSCLEAGG